MIGRLLGRSVPLYNSARANRCCEISKRDIWSPERIGFFEFSKVFIQGIGSDYMNVEVSLWKTRELKNKFRSRDRFA
jgi:hypothetical protein